MGHFNFKNLIKHFINTGIPKIYLCMFGGLFAFVVVGMIVGNMYLNEMLFLEGVEKSTPMFTEEELRTYGEYYKELELDFQSKIAKYIQDYANRTNRHGDKIKWGVYGQNNSDDLKNDDFVDGVTIKYAKTVGKIDGQDNFQDILAAVSILADQSQSRNETVVKNLIQKLFEMSHTFNGVSSSLYKCEHGCFCDFYHCSDAQNTVPFEHCNIKYQPFKVEGHDEYADYTSDDFEIVNILGECEVCKDDSSKKCYEQRGCEQNGTCFHGSGGSGRSDDGNMGSSYGECSNYVAVPSCAGSTDVDHDCHAGETIDGEVDSLGRPKVKLGCGGYYQCNGHPHYECPFGHYYVCCMGHTNVTINVKIMYLTEMIDVIKNGYDIDDGDV